MTNHEAEVEKLRAQAGEEFRGGNAEVAKDLLLKAWALFPEPRELEPESFSIAKSLVTVFLHLGDYESALDWADILQRCDLDRLDSGEREFVAARVLYEMGRENDAWKYFDVANAKSKGRCFLNKEERYKRFYESHESPPEQAPSEGSVESLCARGNALMEERRFQEAARLFEDAFSLLPEPRVEQEVSTWIKASIGDAYFLTDQYQAALDEFLFAYKCPDALANPFINLRLGQCFYALGDETRAREYLQRAYMLEGTKIFDGEATQYLELVDK